MKKSQAIPEPMFDLVPVPVRPVRARPADNGSPRWTAYRAARRQRCDDCMALHIEDPAAPLARMACWARRQGTDRRLQCSANAQLQKEAEAAGSNLARNQSAAHRTTPQQREGQRA